MYIKKDREQQKQIKFVSIEDLVPASATDNTEPNPPMDGQTLVK